MTERASQHSRRVKPHLRMRRNHILPVQRDTRAPSRVYARSPRKRIDREDYRISAEEIIRSVQNKLGHVLKTRQLVDTENGQQLVTISHFKRVPTSSKLVVQLVSLGKFQKQKGAPEESGPEPVHLIEFIKRKGKGHGGVSHRAITESLRRGRLPLPERLMVSTKFQKQFALNNPGFPTSSANFEPTFCYDVDPTIGSTAMPFFTEIMTLYRYYRTIKSRVKVSFATKENFPIVGLVHPVNYLVSAPASGAIIESFLSNRLCAQDQLATITGKDEVILHNEASTYGFAGSKWLGDEDLYSSTGTVSPANNWYWVVGIQSLVSLVNGVTVNFEMEVDFVAFEENSPTS